MSGLLRVQEPALVEENVLLLDGATGSLDHHVVPRPAPAGELNDVDAAVRSIELDRFLTRDVTGSSDSPSNFLVLHCPSPISGAALLPRRRVDQGFEVVRTVLWRHCRREDEVASVRAQDMAVLARDAEQSVIGLLLEAPQHVQVVGVRLLLLRLFLAQPCREREVDAEGVL